MREKGDIRYSNRKIEKGIERKKNKLIPYGHYTSPSYSFCEIARYSICLQQLYFFFFFLDSQTAGRVTSCSEGVADVTGEVVKLRLGKTPGIESKRLF